MLENNNKKQQIQELLKSKNTISMRKLKSVLGRHINIKFDQAWKSHLAGRNSFSALPVEIETYQKMLHKARFFDNRANGQRRPCKKISPNWYQKRQKAKSAASNKSQDLCHAAAEYLGDHLSNNPMDSFWIYGSIDVFNGGLDVDSMPQVITSRSLNNQSSTSHLYPIKSIDDIKRDLLEDVLREIEIEEQASDLDEIKRDQGRKIRPDRMLWLTRGNGR